jgi:iron complex outermembrane receptor protein
LDTALTDDQKNAASPPRTPDSVTARFCFLSLLLAASLEGATPSALLPSPVKKAAAPAAPVVPPTLPLPSADDLTLLDPLNVGADAGDGFDATGMGGPDAEMNEPPFSNDLLTGPQREEDFSPELNAELSVAAGASPVDLATGVNRVNLRGFPTPRLRNGFSQTGIPEILSIERVELIQGPLTPVAGRAAPGGIQNFVTARPRAKNYTRVEFSADTQNSRQARVETSAAIIPKKMWHRLAAGWQHRDGPEDFSRSDSRYVSGSLTFRHSRSASTMVILDYSELSANPAPGVPEYRLTSSGKIIGPWRPLAEFNTYGPNAGIEKKLASASIQFEGQLGRRVSIRASLQGWMRELTEDRFTTSQYVVDLGRFGGTREPQRIEQPLQALSAGVETTARLLAFKADHKVTLLVESNHLRYDRQQRALPTSVRNTLPLDAREFDPDAPNYFRPAYSPQLYSRILTDRHEATSYTSVSLSERAAFWQGRLVATTGVRTDFVTLDLEDNRPGASRPRVTDKVRELTYHAGGNYQLIPSQLLVFANTSSAFEPSTRVDARTGRIQGNETTLGFETGVKGLFLAKRLSATALLFRYYNQNISRRNPLYEDPIADAAQNQPQLVAAGEEQFTGGTIDLKTAFSTVWTFSGRATITQALTTASPDLPEEIGRPLTRLPRTTLGLSARRTFTGRLTGFSLGSTLTYVSNFVAYYESASRQYLAYPGNTLVSLNAGYSWKKGPKTRPLTHNVGVGVRNLFDRDLLASHARVGQQRAFNASYSLGF